MVGIGADIHHMTDIVDLPDPALSGKLKNLHFIDIASHVDRAK
jgi:hypothetical protein